MINFNYFADVKKTLYDKKYKHSLAFMKKAGVSSLWLIIYITGRYTATKAEIIKAKKTLEALGFEVNAITIPVGHPGNALNPEEALELKLPENWSYRVNHKGENVYFCACVNQTITKENREVVEFCRDAGFKKLFFDDDLRTANHGDTICGCFCDSCIKEFCEIEGTAYTRGEIAKACEENTPLCKKWYSYNCSKITRFMKETALDNIQTGIMVMLEGGIQHGIDISAIKEAVPHCLFRVGEGHFDDFGFENDFHHQKEISSIKNHLNIINNTSVVYSETTVFPPRALSPENLIRKAEIAVEHGIENIFLMSGTWVMDDKYWQALENNYSRLCGKNR